MDAIKTKERVTNAIIPDDPRANLDEYQAAKWLGVSVFLLRRWRWSGSGPVFLKYGGAVRYEQESLEKFTSTRKRRSTSDDGKNAA